MRSDLWKCLECNAAYIDKTKTKECRCGGELEYYGETTYTDKKLGTQPTTNTLRHVKTLVKTIDETYPVYRDGVLWLSVFALLLMHVLVFAELGTAGILTIDKSIINVFNILGVLLVGGIIYWFARGMTKAIYGYNKLLLTRTMN